MTRTVIASLPEARAALEAAISSGVAAELESPPDAASIYGVLWFAELNRALLAEFPDVPFSLTLDCGERADLAHAALVEGIKRIRFSGHPEVAKALKDITRQVGADLVASELLYVIAELDLSDQDDNWIQSVRKLHDPQFDLIGPHFTLVFGTDAMPVDALIARVKAIADDVSPFAFDLQRIEVVQDHFLFLVPDKGAHELAMLYERLRLEPSDIAFAPHVTIGRIANATAAKGIADQLNGKMRPIHGRVSSLKVLAVDGQRARDLATIELKGH